MAETFACEGCGAVVAKSVYCTARQGAGYTMFYTCPTCEHVTQVPE